MTTTNTDRQVIEKNNIWVDVDHYYEQNLSPELVQEMEELGRDIYEAGEKPRVLHKDSLGKVLNDEFQILENNRNNLLRLKFKYVSEGDINKDMDLFLLLCSFIWLSVVLITGLSVGFLIEYILQINLQSFMLTAIAFAPLIAYLITCINKPYFSHKNIPYFLGVIFFFSYLFIYEMSFLINALTDTAFNINTVIQVIISFLPILLLIKGRYKKFLNYIENLKIIKKTYKTTKIPLEICDYPGYEDSIKINKTITLESLTKSIDKYFKHINEQDKRQLDKDHFFKMFYLQDSSLKNCSKFFLLYKNKVNLNLINTLLDTDLPDNTINQPSQNLLGPTYPIIYSSNKNFIHIGTLPVDEEKIATLVARSSLSLL